ncbi:MAG: NAD(+) kinase, partial [Candidatus Gastranaerophilales bacterium]|nr:NAD(+) kinase [Candidatus Gastranaerophilales bacterium]
ADNYIALNDFVIKGGLTGRTSRFALEINGRFVCEYLADGIIISTPTGSTAYGMAAGGPVLAPETDVIVIVPICPHTFSARPIVVSADDVVKICPCQNNEYTVSADGQIIFSLQDGIEISKSDKKAKLALLNENDFYSVLRNKLHWGISPAKI